MADITYRTRRQILGFDEQGFRVWQVIEEARSLPAEKTALIIVDMWDRHWSEGFSRRTAALAGPLDAAVRRSREAGVLIVHAPSGVEAFYAHDAVRRRLLAAPPVTPPERPVPAYPLPIDDTDGGSETLDLHPPYEEVWTCQSPGIFIDQTRDVLCGDEGDRLYSYLVSRGITCLLYTGVATNMCVLHRSFGIKPMLARGLEPFLVRNLTDVIYNPARPPYVTHAEARALVVGYVEKFYCPSLEL